MTPRPLSSPRGPAAIPADWLPRAHGALQPAAAAPVAGAVSRPAVPLQGALPSPDEAPPRTRSWWRVALWLARDAAIGLALITSIPLWHIARHDPPATGRTEIQVEKLSTIEPLRAYMLPRDGNLSAAQAGTAYRAVARLGSAPGVSMLPGPAPIPRSWRESAEPDDARFADLRRRGSGLPDPTRILKAASRPITPDELAYLRSIAESPVWSTLEQVVRAPMVDLLGARVRLPVGPTASPLMLPMVRYSDMRELADAGVARAAFHVATGDHERAEAALRLVISHGFMLIDHGSESLDGLVGRVIVEVGGHGLRDLQQLTGDAAGLMVTEALSDQARPARPAALPASAADRTAMLVSLAGDATRPRTLRLDALQELSLGTCRSVRGVLLGHSHTVEQAFREAERTLVRVPSDAAMLTLLREAPERPLQPGSYGWTSLFLPGAAQVAGAVTRNPRFENCPILVDR